MSGLTLMFGLKRLAALPSIPFIFTWHVDDSSSSSMCGPSRVGLYPNQEMLTGINCVHSRLLVFNMAQTVLTSYLQVDQRDVFY